MTASTQPIGSDTLRSEIVFGNISSSPNVGKESLSTTRNAPEGEIFTRAPVQQPPVNNGALTSDTSSDALSVFRQSSASAGLSGKVTGGAPDPLNTPGLVRVFGVRART